MKEEQIIMKRRRSFLQLSARCSLLAAVLWLTAHSALLTDAKAQIVVDKTVATINNGSLTVPDVITYSDLVWQMALQPDTPIDKPASKDLNTALKRVEDQRLILLEAKKLPGSEPTAKEIQDRRDELAREFGSAAVLQERMARVGLTTEQLNEILSERIEVENYIDFRFRAFVLISDKEIVGYYNEFYGRQRNTGHIVPTLAEAREAIRSKLTEEKIATQIDNFVDSLRERAEIVVLNPV
jgi:hypothetical protein